MSGAQQSGFANQLFDPMMAIHQQEGQNQLLQQQQDIGGHEMEMAGRLAGTLLSQYQTPEARAAAYPTLLANARALAPGYFKNAPATYPGDDVTHALALAGTPSQTQAEWAQNLAANKAYSNANTPSAAPAAGGGAAAPAAPAAPGATIGQRQNNPGNLTFAGQPYASPGQGNRFASFPDMATGVAANADQLSLYQTQHGINTVRGAVTRWVGDPKADLTSYVGDIAKSLGVGPDDKIDLTDPAVQAKFIQAQFPHESAGGGYVLNPADVAKGVQMAAARRGQQVQPTPPAAVAAVPGAPAAPGATATPAPYRVAGAMQPPPGTATAPGQAAPAPGQPAAPSGAASAQPPAPAAPGGGPAPPQLQPLNENGVTPIQQRQIDAMAANPQTTLKERMAVQQGFVNQNIQLQQKQFSDWIQTQQLQTSQGQLTVAQQNSALEYWKAAHPDAKVTLTGGEIVTQNPRTGEEIAPRIKVNPTASPRPIEGSASWDGTQWVPAIPGKPAVLGHWAYTGAGRGEFQPLDPGAVAAQKEAAAAGTATGTATVKQYQDLVARAQNAASQESQIDYATNQLREAAKGGIPTGYFSQGLATAAAAAKSLGFDGVLKAAGIDPAAVGNAQTAQKTLSVIGGAILRQALGPGSAVTEGKIEQFIHTQPGIETDPQALQRIMAWARSQYTYEREMGTAAVTEAAKPENAGRLPPHWQAAYYRDHGFAPIYNPDTQEMQQPDGRQPTRETPGVATLPTAARSSLTEGHDTTFSNGQVWTLRNGQPVQVR